MKLDDHISHNEHKRWFEQVPKKLAPTTLTCSKTQKFFGLGSGRTLRSSVALANKIVELQESYEKKFPSPNDQKLNNAMYFFWNITFQLNDLNLQLPFERKLTLVRQRHTEYASKRDKIIQ